MLETAYISRNVDTSSNVTSVTRSRYYRLSREYDKSFHCKIIEKRGVHLSSSVPRNVVYICLHLFPGTWCTFVFICSPERGVHLSSSVPRNVVYICLHLFPGTWEFTNSLISRICNCRFLRNSPNNPFTLHPNLIGYIFLVIFF